MMMMMTGFRVLGQQQYLPSDPRELRLVEGEGTVEKRRENVKKSERGNVEVKGKD